MKQQLALFKKGDNVDKHITRLTQSLRDYKNFTLNNKKLTELMSSYPNVYKYTSNPQALQHILHFEIAQFHVFKIDEGRLVFEKVDIQMPAHLNKVLQFIKEYFNEWWLGLMQTI